MPGVGSATGQLVSAIASGNALMVGQAPAASLGMTAIVAAQTMGMVMDNAVVAQRGMQRIAEATVVLLNVLIVTKGGSSPS